MTADLLTSTILAPDTMLVLVSVEAGISLLGICAAIALMAYQHLM